MEGQAKDHLEPWHELPYKAVTVTGASSVLGRDFCLDLAQAGCRIVAATRCINRLKTLCDEINGLSSSSNSEAEVGSLQRAVAVELYVTADGPAIERLVQSAWEAFGRSEALVNNAVFLVTSSLRNITLRN